MVAEDLLTELNEQQKKVVKTLDGPLLVLAGAGTGKTRCIIYRAGYLIASGKVAKENLLIVTFTNKAARELRKRLEDTFNLNGSRLWVGTFHSLFGKILRYEASHLPFSSSYVIYDSKDQVSLIKKLLKKSNIDAAQFKPKQLLNIISNQKNNLIKPEHFWSFNNYNSRTKVIHKIYKEYQQRLLDNNALDFDDILMHTAYLLDENPEICQKWQKVFRYIMIDEYQDTNYAQFQIISHLAKKHQNICVVGDDDQAIYTWRGATIKNILNFESDFDKVKKVKLERNYRSHANILNLANSLINYNKNRHGKELFTDRVSDEKPSLVQLDNESVEAEYVVELISSYAERSALSDCAVLYRINAQSRVLEQVFTRHNIPYRIYGGVNFFMRKEIKDLLCYLKFLANPQDQESLLRALDIQKGIGKSTINKLVLEAQRKNITLYEMLQEEEYPFLSTRPCRLVKDFHKMCLTLKKSCDSISLEELMMQVLKDSHLGEKYGIETEHDTDGKRSFANPEDQSRYENICELIASAKEYSQDFYEEHQRQPLLTEYLTNAVLQTDLDTNSTDSDAVNLMTLHNAKGLEFDHVIIIGLEEGLLPHNRSMDNESKIEEERRLLYVGITRARHTLHLTLTRSRRKINNVEFSKPSSFIKNFDPEFIETIHFDPYAYLKPSRPARKKPTRNHILESHKHFKIGQNIRHSNLGIGMILSVDGKGRNARLIIKFDNGTIKKVLGNYVEIV